MAITGDCTHLPAGLGTALNEQLWGIYLQLNPSSRNLANSHQATTIKCVAGFAAKMNRVTSDFRSLLLSSFAVAALSFALPFFALPTEAAAFKFSLLLAFVWISMVVFAGVKYRWRALWLLFGVPLVGYWFVVLYSIAAACAQNIKNCP